jgi:hypothetical protein
VRRYKPRATPSHARAYFCGSVRAGRARRRAVVRHRLHRTHWRAVCGVCRGKIQGQRRVSSVHSLCARSTSPEASTSSSACLCNAGLWLFSSGSGCIGCEPSTYKDVIGNQACTACPANTYPAEIPNADWLTPRTSSTCMECPSGSSCTDSKHARNELRCMLVVSTRRIPGPDRRDFVQTVSTRHVL